MTDRSLAERIRAGEEEAFHEFRLMYAGPFYHYFRRRGLSDVAAQDLTADCLTDIPLKVSAHFDPSHTSFPAWVNLLRQRAATDWWRRHGKAPAVGLDGDVPDETDEACHPDLIAMEAVTDAMSRLDPVDQQLLWLRYGGQLQPSFPDLARELGSLHQRPYQEATLRQRHGRALRRLEALLRDDPRLKHVLRRI
jgi:DNA-directed RNA polymerase specialized sigma24 family protein